MRAFSYPMALCVSKKILIRLVFQLTTFTVYSVLLQPSVKKSKTLFTGPYFRKLVLMLFYYFGFLIGAEPEAAGL